MTEFATKTQHIATLTEQDLQTGFATCSGFGMMLNSANVNAVLKKITDDSRSEQQSIRDEFTSADTQIINNTTQLATALMQTDGDLQNQINGINVEQENLSDVDDTQNDTIAELIQRINDLEARPITEIPCGGLFETTINYANGEQVAQALGYGQWSRYAEGRTTVGLQTGSADPEDIWTKIIGEEFGEYDHVLTVDEMPEHRITMRGDDADYGENNGGDGFVAYVSGGAGDNSAAYSEYIGGNQPHNNVPPSVVVGKWVRVDCDDSSTTPDSIA